MRDIPTIIVAVFTLLFSGCGGPQQQQSSEKALATIKDVPFVQEYHVGFSIGETAADNEVRSIAVDQSNNVWTATAAGVYRKDDGSRKWVPVITGENRGPAFAVNVTKNGDVLLGVWDGIYRFSGGKLVKEKGPKPPISVICNAGEECHALGPNGIWKSDHGNWKEEDILIARSVRDAEVDADGNLWVATNVGIYKVNGGNVTLFQDTNELISCYSKAVTLAPDGRLWAGVMGGVSIRENDKLAQNLTPENGISSVFVNCIEQAPDGDMWVGTDVGVVRYDAELNPSLLFSKRWLTHNKVTDVAFDSQGNAWVGTTSGVSAIMKKEMTLASKHDHYYHELMTKHIREPWICGNLRLEVPGDTSTWRNTDDDNDGEYTGGYLAMESFRYAVTKDPDALEKAQKAFHFLKLLQEVTGTEAFFARTIVPTDWTFVHDPNRTYTEKQIADELVRDPRHKPVEERWRKSVCGNWLYKGDTSSDEMCGHMMGYYFFYKYAATETDKAEIRAHVRTIVNGLIKNDFNLLDIDGKHTRWGVWSPDNLNRDPDWMSEQAINSFEILAFLKFAWGITGDEKYQKAYRKLIDEENYLDNVAKLNKKNPAWQIYFDRTLEAYIFPLLMEYENDPELMQFYMDLAEAWMAKQTSGENLINNLTYALYTGKKVNVQQTLDFLRDTPLDLVDWTIDHTIREDVKLVRYPIPEEVQIAELPHASIRATVRWDKNPWAAIHGHPSRVREPVFWLWPYWMARYLEIISE